jgi:hypothetical protein
MSHGETLTPNITLRSRAESPLLADASHRVSGATKNKLLLNRCSRTLLGGSVQQTFICHASHCR